MRTDSELTWTRKLLLSGMALAFFALLFALLALAGELVVRRIAPQSDSFKLGERLPGSARLFGLQPNVRTLQTGVLVETNSLGFREREYPLARVPGVRRIAVLGDSFTFGVGVPFEETYSKRLEALLNRTEAPHEVINFGVSAYNTVLELATWREVASRFRPDMVIVGYVLNDAERMGAGAGPQGARSMLNAAHVELKNASVLYRWMAPKLGAVLGMLFDARYAVGGTNQVLRSFAADSPGWRESRQALLDIAAEARAAGAEPLVVIFPAMIDFSTYPVRGVHRQVAQFCREQGIPVLDLLARFEREDASRLAVPFDGHPNAAAHRIFAEEIYAAIVLTGRSRFEAVSHPAR